MVKIDERQPVFAPAKRNSSPRLPTEQPGPRHHSKNETLLAEQLEKRERLRPCVANRCDAAGLRSDEREAKDLVRAILNAKTFSKALGLMRQSKFLAKFLFAHKDTITLASSYESAILRSQGGYHRTLYLAANTDETVNVVLHERDSCVYRNTDRDPYMDEKGMLRLPPGHVVNSANEYPVTPHTSDLDYENVFKKLGPCGISLEAWTNTLIEHFQKKGMLLEQELIEVPKKTKLPFQPPKILQFTAMAMKRTYRIMENFFGNPVDEAQTSPSAKKSLSARESADLVNHICFAPSVFDALDFLISNSRALGQALNLANLAELRLSSTKAEGRRYSLTLKAAPNDPQKLKIILDCSRVGRAKNKEQSRHRHVLYQSEDLKRYPDAQRALQKAELATWSEEIRTLLKEADWL